MKNNKEFIDPETLPIFIKGQEIYDVVFQITELFPYNNEDLQYIKAILLNDAAILTSKIVGACNAGLYDVKMESAAIIRKAANDLKIQNHSLEMFGFKEVDYYDIVRRLIEEFRILYIDWVNEFDPWEYLTDPWGLFNPPGVGPNDGER